MVQPKTAIVAEGGGQRGIYTAGVLDAFLAEGFNPFDLGVGVSAGAQNLLAFFLGQPGYAKRAIVELTSRADFMLPKRCLRMHSMLDLDGYFETSVHDPQYRLPYEDIATVAQHRRLQFVATDKQTLSSVYLEPDASNVVDYLKASSAVPFLYRHGVPIGGMHLVDGGVAGPLPIQHAYEEGARHIVVVRTVPELATDKSSTHWRRCRQLARRWPVNTLLPVRMLEQREQAIRCALEFMQHPPKTLQLHIIAPVKSLKSKWIASPLEDLLSDYQQGLDAGYKAIAELRNVHRAYEPADSERVKAIV